MSSIKHDFVSAVPDNTNPAEVQGSHWNAPHVFEPPVKGLLYDPIGSGEIVGLQTVGLLQDRIGDGTITPVRVHGLLNDAAGDGNIVGVQHRGLLMDKAGNGIYSGVDVVGVPINPTGNNNYVGVSAASEGQVLRRKLNTVLPEYEFASGGPWIFSADYAFAAVPGVSLTAGTPATITLNPLPAGITADSPGISHKIYIADPNVANNNEVVSITAVSGNTITFTPAKNHAAASFWGLRSATAGIQEAFLANSNPHIILPPGDSYIFGPIVIYGRGGTGVTISGQGITNSRIIRHPEFTSGNGIYYNSNLGVGHCLLRDFTFINALSIAITSFGIYLTVTDLGEAHILRVRVEEGRNPVGFDGVGGVKLENVEVGVSLAYSNAFPVTAGITANCSTFSLLNDICVVNISASGTGTCAGIIISNLTEGRILGGYYTGRHGIVIAPDNVNPLSSLIIANVLIRRTWDHGILFTGVANAVNHNRVAIQNCIIDSQLVGSNDANGIYVGTNVSALNISGNEISGFRKHGIVLNLSGQVLKGTVISNNTINNNGKFSGSGIYVGCPISNLVISGNQIGNTITSLGAATQINAIYFAAGTKSNIAITGNDLSGNVNTPIVQEDDVFNGIIENNTGLNDTLLVVAAAASINIGYNSLIAVTGSTLISKMTPVWPGRKLTIIWADAAPGGLGNTAGGNVLLGHIGTSNGTTTVTFSPTWWF